MSPDVESIAILLQYRVMMSSESTILEVDEGWSGSHMASIAGGIDRTVILWEADRSRLVFIGSDVEDCEMIDPYRVPYGLS